MADPESLDSEINEKWVMDSVLSAAGDCEEITASLEAATQAWPDSDHRVSAFFEHGHWWVRIPTTGRTWSVVDIVRPDGEDDFDFEMVSEGDLDG